MPHSNIARIGIVTVSDRASRGEYEDRGGPAIQDYLSEVLTSDWLPLARVIPDELQTITKTLKELCDQEQCCLVVTTGGTGPAKRDITPEATLAVSEKEMPGFGELMAKSLPGKSTNRDPVPTDGRHPGRNSDHQLTRSTQGDSGMHGRCIPRCALLY